MKLLIDDVNIEAIRSIYEYYPIDGITCNPTILAKNGTDPYTCLTEIRAFIGEDADLHVQVLSKTYREMVEEAKEIISRLGKNTYVKIPSVKEGFAAMRILKKEGIRVTATAVYTPLQAYLAAKSGADYVAPYVNRIDNMGYDGIDITKRIQDIFDTNGSSTQILAASFKNSQQVLELCEYGIGAATVAPDVIANFVKNPAIDAAVDTFISDFENAFGENKTMKN